MARYQLGLQVHDPTASQKTFRRALADLGLAKAPKRPWRDRRQEAEAAWLKECNAVLQPQLCSWRGRASAGASEPSAAGGGERASADGVAQAAGVAATASSAELGAAAEAQSEGASEPRAQQQAGADSAMQPAEESGELPGTAPRLGELAYATGEWAQWSHHCGYKELLQLPA